MADRQLPLPGFEGDDSDKLIRVFDALPPGRKLMVKVKISRKRHRIPAQMLGIVGRRAIIKPIGHKDTVKVPLSAVSPWKSKNKRIE
jgi:hypothetical protein